MKLKKHYLITIAVVAGAFALAGYTATVHVGESVTVEITAEEANTFLQLWLDERARLSVEIMEAQAANETAPLALEKFNQMDRLEDRFARALAPPLAEVHPEVTAAPKIPELDSTTDVMKRLREGR